MTSSVVGEAPLRPNGVHQVGVYIGNIPELKGKTAIVAPHRDSDRFVCAQFDDMETGRGLGWWMFPHTDFRITYSHEFSKAFALQYGKPDERTIRETTV